MKDLFLRRPSAMSCRSRAVRPVLEGLEGRVLMYAASGDHFALGSLITWSIEPDGTNIAGTPSNLVGTFNARFGAGNWQRAIQDAFAVWENVANINASQIPDYGNPFNSLTLQQGSPWFGDIRIGGFTQAAGALGFTLLPPPANGGSNAGDIILNTNQSWQIGSDYDLETVMIHEIGHALGMSHSADSTASMYAYYHGVQQFVNTDDINGIQSIWSPRQEDSYAVAYQNFNAAHAADVTSTIGANNQVNLGPLDSARSSESYWFKVTTPATAAAQLQAVAESSGLSEFSPKVTLYDAGFHVLSQNSAPANSYGSVVNAPIYNATPNTTYYIKVSSATAGSTGTGAYALLINMGTQNLSNFPPPNTQVLAQPDQGGGSSQVSTNDPGSSGPNAPAPVVLPAVVGPVSNPGMRDGNQGGNGKSGKSGDSGEPGPMMNLDAWENIHNFKEEGRSGNPSHEADVPDLLKVGNDTLVGDLLLTAQGPPTLVAKASARVVTEGTAIAIDPTVDPEATPSPTKKSTAARLINIAHPAGPF